MLGIVSDDVWDAELNNDTSGPAGARVGTNVDSAIIIPIEHGRGNKPEVPELIRELASEDAISGMPARDVAEKYNISESSVSAYKNSATSTASYHEPVTSLQKSNDRVRAQIVSTAKSKLIQALEHITSDKLASAKVRDVASVAKDMAGVVRDMEPQISNAGINANFTFHVPRSKKESDYDVIDVSN